MLALKDGPQLSGELAVSERSLGLYSQFRFCAQGVVGAVFVVAAAETIECMFDLSMPGHGRASGQMDLAATLRDRLPQIRRTPSATCRKQHHQTALRP